MECGCLRFVRSGDRGEIRLRARSHARAEVLRYREDHPSSSDAAVNRARCRRLLFAQSSSAAGIDFES